MDLGKKRNWHTCLLLLSCSVVDRKKFCRMKVIVWKVNIKLISAGLTSGWDILLLFRSVYLVVLIYNINTEIAETADKLGIGSLQTIEKHKAYNEMINE